MEKKPKMLIVMRHGEREDDESLKNDKSIINKYDPKLTQRGKSQAELIGEQVELIAKKTLNKEIKDLRIHLISSPFLRTLMTSDAFLSGFLKRLEDSNISLNNVSAKMHYGLYEFLHKRNFDKHPQDFLEINNLEKMFYQIPFLKNFMKEEFTIKGDFPSKFPENWEELINRYRKALIDIKNEFINSSDEVLILVTHGYAVQAIATELNSQDDCSIIDYCSTFVFKIEPNGESIQLESLNIINQL